MPIEARESALGSGFLDLSLQTRRDEQSMRGGLGMGFLRVEVLVSMPLYPSMRPARNDEGYGGLGWKRRTS